MLRAMSRERPIQLEAGGKWAAFPCQGGDGVCRVPIAPQRDGKGNSWGVLSVDGAPLTLHPSIDCATCGFHGHIQDGQIINSVTPGSRERYERHLAQAFGEDEL